MLDAARKVLAEAETLRRTGREKEAEYVAATAWGGYQKGWKDTSGVYVGFEAEMRRSYKAKAILWGWLLARRRVVIACQCVTHDRCHHSLVARILGQCSPRVRVMGEIAR